MSFHEECLRRAGPIWEAMLAHPFLKETAEGRVDRQVFGNWMRQDYLFVQEAIRFVSVLVSRAPESLTGQLSSAVPALQAELELFRRMAAEKGVHFENLRMTPTCHAYVQFLLATAHSASFEEGFTLLYGAEKSYFDSWRRVRANLVAESPWEPFIERWAGSEFEQWVGWLETALDEVAGQASPSLREKMIEIFLLTGQYEILFWDMALRGEAWPA